MNDEKYLLVAGGGSAGFACAYRALKHGNFRVVLSDRNAILGGTSTCGGVNCWEPGIGGNGVHAVLAERLERSGMGFVGESRGTVCDATPWGISVRSASPYASTLVRGSLTGPEQRRFHFEPEAMHREMYTLLQEAGGSRLEYFPGTEITGVTVEKGKITSVTLRSEDGTRSLSPALIADCTGDIALARMAGCACSVGEDPESRFGEPSAPAEPNELLNGISLVFRVTRASDGYIEPVPEEYSDVDLREWLDLLRRTNRPLSCFNYYPNGDININMLPTVPGEALLRYTPEELRHICEARVYAYWNWVCAEKGFRGYRICRIFPMTGIRESYRLLGRYVLTENDLLSGYPSSLAPGRAVAYADHPADLHGKTGKKGGMTCFERYAIPYDCLIPNETGNLIVACRGASFSHIAASSARLSRTMLALGEAAGAACVQCIENGIAPEDADVAQIRELLNIP